MHTFVILCETTTLNVAFNSHNKALLTIMLSNNVITLFHTSKAGTETCRPSIKDIKIN